MAARRPFATMPRVRTRLVALGACLLALWCCAPAAAFDPAEAREVADRTALAWARGQEPGGALVDPVSKRPTGGYPNVMFGYALLRAGERRDDARLVAAGVRAVDASLARPVAERGVFDTLAVATAYSFARRKLADDPAFARSRPRWEEYLRAFGEPSVSDKVAACDADPQCFHNHEAVEAYGDLALADTGLRPDSAELRAAALAHLTAELPTQGPVALLSDTGSWPLAYHGLSAGMVGGAVSLLGADAPPGVRESLRRAVDTSAALMAPDGDVAYVGRRQQQGWALAGTVWAATAALRVADGGGRAQAVADRAFERLVRLHATGPDGTLGAVPHKLDSYRGLDANGLTSVALVVFMLNLAADEQDAAGAVDPAPLPADRDAAFVDARRSGVASVRHGDLWFAVHRRPDGGKDLRYDFGLMALKRRAADGEWHDVLRPRPLTRGPSGDSAGPVIVADGQRWLPWGTRIAARPGGVVEVRGGWRSQDGTWLRRGVTFRFAPVRGGVELTFPLRAGDSARLTTFLPRESADGGDTTVSDDRSVATLSPRPAAVRLTPGYASCCDADLVAATMTVRPARDGPVVYTVRAREKAAERAGPGGSAWPAVVIALLAAAAGTGALLRLRAGKRSGASK
jgi:hypothetical protein